MNLYEAYLMTINAAVEETPDTRTFRLTFQDPAVAESFAFAAGQFGEYSAFGAGECTFCIASPSTRRGYVECTFKAAGNVTRALLDQRDKFGDVTIVYGARPAAGPVFTAEEIARLPQEF
jgi:sulfhydrogenase subunit gamma (sulfur reductase)